MLKRSDKMSLTNGEADSAVISHTYDLALEVVREAEQGLGYGMPALVYRGSPLLSVMRAKKHFGIYPLARKAEIDG